MKRETFCKFDFFEKNGIVKEYFFQNSKKYAKGFQLFLKKLNSILRDLYEYLFLKFQPKILLLNDQVIYYQRQHAYCNILMGRIAAGVCFEIVTVIALNHPVSAAGNLLQKPKNSRFWKNILLKQAFFVVNRHFWGKKTDITKTGIFRHKF